jgi:hypothetical protein
MAVAVLTIDGGMAEIGMRLEADSHAGFARRRLRASSIRV